MNKGKSQVPMSSGNGNKKYPLHNFDSGNRDIRDSSKNNEDDTISNGENDSLVEQGHDVFHNADSLANNLRDGMDTYKNLKGHLPNKGTYPENNSSLSKEPLSNQELDKPKTQSENANPQDSGNNPNATMLNAGKIGDTNSGSMKMQSPSETTFGSENGAATSGTGSAAGASAGAGTGAGATASTGAGTGSAATATGAATAGGPVIITAGIILLVIAIIFIIFIIIASIFYVFLSSASTTGEEVIVNEEYPDSNEYQSANDNFLSAFKNNLGYVQDASEDALMLARQEVKDFAKANGFNVKETIEAYDEYVSAHPPFATVNWADLIIVYSMGKYSYNFGNYDKNEFIQYMQKKEALHYMYFLEFEAVIDCEGAYEFKDIEKEIEYSSQEKKDGTAKTIDTRLKVKIYPYSLSSLYDRIKNEDSSFSPYEYVPGTIFTYEEFRTIQQFAMSAYLKDKIAAGWDSETPWSRAIHHYPGCPLKDIEAVDNTRLSDWLEQFKNTLENADSKTFGQDGEYIYDDTVKREYVNGIPRFYQGRPEAWSGMTFSGSGKTFASVGCTLTSVSMLVSFFTGEIHTPPDIYNNNKDCWSGAAFKTTGYTELAKRYGYKCVWGYGESERVLTDAYSFSGKYSSTARENMDIVRHLQEGHTLILELGKPYASGSTHYVVVSGIDKNGKLIVNDPNYSKGDKMDWSIDKVNASLQRVYAFKK